MNDWELLDLEPINDLKSIKRAYARKIKKIDPSQDPTEFQKIREAYEYLTDHGRYYVDDDYGDSEVDEDEIYQENVAQQIPGQQLKFDKEHAVEIQVLEADTVEKEIQNSEDITDAIEEIELKLVEPDKTEAQMRELQVATEVQPSSPQEEYFDPDEIVDDFIQQLKDLYSEDKDIDLQEWISILDKDELHYLEVNDMLRFDTFGFFLSKVESVCGAEDTSSEMRAKLPKGIDKVINYYATHFDWENTDLLLARQFGHEQMQLLSNFYLKPAKQVEEAVETEQESSSGFGTFFIWVAIFLAIKFVRAFFE